ncbi:MAG: 4Fe-4S dicluster domain-containing protein [Acidobacteria bacterium]|nr:MAG: 4Fe-4S dicluster domain-containing protein [Acidobacteriota bacterium]
MDDHGAVGEKVNGTRVGKAHWRSLDELADTPEFRALVEKEFPGLAEELTSPRTRRAFLKVMGASLGIAGLAACRWPKETILPFANRPEDRIPGVPQQYATAMELAGAAVGLLVTSYDGRPVKIEGNPLHPASRGAAGAFAQASLLELYDPDRSQQVVRRDGDQTLASSWDEFTAFAGPLMAALRAKGGAGLAVLSEESSSPSLARLRQRLAELMPEAKWFAWEPISRDDGRGAAARTFGEPLRPLLRFDRADVVVCLDADPISDHPDAVAYARAFASRRRGAGGTMSRVYSAGPVMSLTAAAADHRLAVPSHRVAGVAARTLAELERLGVTVPGGRELAALATADPGETAFAAAAAAELAAARGRGLVVAGPGQTIAHDIAAAINAALGNVGATVVYVRDGLPAPASAPDGLDGFLDEIERGAVETAVILGGNPAYAAAPVQRFIERYRRAPVRLHLSHFDDETSRASTWHLPRAHYLEAWGDARSWDGTYSVQQPLIAALYGGRTPIEVVASLLGEATTAGYEIVRATFKTLAAPGDFEATWRKTLNDGVLAGSAFPEVAAVVSSTGRASAAAPAGTDPAAAGFEVVFVADASVHDGRFANNAWLQEMPDPLTKITWDNAALLSPRTAAAIGARHGDVVRVTRGDRTVEIAAYVMPGQADGTVVLPLGYGRSAAGSVGNGVGANAYVLRGPGALRFARGVAVERAGRTHTLACTQDQQAIDRVGYEARGQRIAEIVREATLAEFLADPEFVRKQDEPPAALPIFTSPKLTGEHQWAMSIDLAACIGCNACMVACQAENNIAVVGREQVIRGRAMHWIRVDRYFSGKPETPEVSFQPMACQQCENAPCEQVCPVAATMHSEEGLNEQVYNRCVGTRYCSNNCPYKVRRFNFFNYFKNVPQSEKMAFNPEVTVRGRGVMEKCSFCIQRIETVKIAAKNDRRPIRDGEIVPACAQTCPTQAIVFGDIKDPASRVSGLRADKRSYAVLGELNTKPRITYLAKLRNPSPKLGEG